MVSMDTAVGSLPDAHRAADRPASALEVHLGYWMRLVSNEVSHAFERALQQRDISVAEWVAMNRLAALPGMTPARLAAAMGMTRGAISKVLDKLDSKNLVSRSISPLDSRVQLLSLTQRARRALPQLARMADDNDEYFFGALAPEEKAALRSLLRKVAGAHRITRIPVE